MLSRHFRGTITLSAIILGCALFQPAHASNLTWDLGAIGIAGAVPFSADALKATEVTHISLTGPTTFLEHGFAQVTGIVDANNVMSVPGGLNSSYSLYFEFIVTGSLITQQFTSFSMDLYAVDGVSTFGYDGGDNAIVNNAFAPVLIATNSMVGGSIAGTPFATPLSADSLSIFSPTLAGTPVFLAPSLPSLFHGAFYHPISDISGAVDGGFKLTGGDDTLNFAPEPSAFLLLLGGLPVLYLRRRKA